MGRNAVQILMRNGKVVVQITPRTRISFNISTESSFREKKRNKKCENKYTNKQSFNVSKFWTQKYFDSINDKKNIAIVAKVLQENTNIDIAKMTFDILIDVSETN